MQAGETQFKKMLDADDEELIEIMKEMQQKAMQMQRMQRQMQMKKQQEVIFHPYNTSPNDLIKKVINNQTLA